MQFCFGTPCVQVWVFIDMTILIRLYFPAACVNDNQRIIPSSIYLIP